MCIRDRGPRASTERSLGPWVIHRDVLGPPVVQDLVPPRSVVGHVDALLAEPALPYPALAAPARALAGGGSPQPSVPFQHLGSNPLVARSASDRLLSKGATLHVHALA
eukprot:11488493-Alexandrium_andersonii.AAC.1